MRGTRFPLGRLALAVSSAALLAVALLVGLVPTPRAFAQPAFAQPAFAQPAFAQPPGDQAAGSWLPPTPPGWPVVVDQQRGPERTVTRGAGAHPETSDTVGGRQHAQVLDLDLTDPNLRLGVVEAGDVLTNPADETLSSMAARTHAVAGVNGDYFEIHASGRPLGGVVHDGRVLKSPRPDYHAQLVVKADGSAAVGPETYTGTVAVGAASHELRSVNVVDDLADGAVTRVTPDLGDTGPLPAPAAVVLGHRDGGDLVVDEVRSGVTALPRLAAGQEGLLGAGEGGDWLAARAPVGSRVALTERIGPDPDVRELISGATQLVKDGKPYDDPTGTPPHGINPETAVGVSKDGRHLVLAVLDGRAGKATATGVSPDQVAGYLIAHGADSAVLLDGGGSTEMVARQPGDTAVSVLNTPSDGVERPVANGLFVYSTHPEPEAARAVLVGDGSPVTTVPGGDVALPVRAVDQWGGPAAGATTVRVLPPDLASWADGRLTVHRAGSGVLIATNGSARAQVPLTAVSRLASLAVQPANPDLNNAATQQFSLTGTAAGSHDPVTIPPDAAHWSVDHPELGAVSPAGLFTAAATGTGLVTVTASAGGANATTVVAVGKQTKLADTLSDVANWRLRNTTGMPATLDLAAGDVPPGVTAPGSLRVSYTVPAGAGVKQLVLSTPRSIPLPRSDDGRDPTGVGLWVRGDRGGLTLAESYLQVDGTAVTLYPTTVTWQGWRLVVGDLPAGLKYPLEVNFLDFLAISPSRTTSGTVQVSGLQALYSPRPLVPPTYVPVPDNPSWLHFTTDARTFRGAGPTLLAGDDAHLLASDPGSAASHVLDSIATRLPTLPERARPTAVQALGDMSDTGAPPDLGFARDKLAAVGVPFRDAVGNHEISQGALPENQDFQQVFGETHYGYQLGAAQVLVTDSAHGSLLTSDPYQVPDAPQYPWLVDQLTRATAPTVLLATHMPAYDPHAVADSQFADRWEARMYVRLAQRYQQTHPGRHVAMLSGHARGFAEQVINPDGSPAEPGVGVPQLVFADLGMPAYAPADQGGFYHFGLLHVSGDGQVAFSVEPVLASVTVADPGPLRRGGTVTLTASGTAVGGDNLPPLTVPIATPAAHVWSSADPGVVSVDPVTGVATARHPGTTTVRVTSGGVTATREVTVTT